ncbi:MAG: 6,7-dimethyl-8-ribityllumazine synthase [Patescibacteria group bacterium]
MQIKNKNVIQFDAGHLNIGIVVARFNQDITDELLKFALETLETSRVKRNNIRIIPVAGSVEIPYALQKLAGMKKYDCLVALGCIIRGETPHFDYVCKMAQEGVLRVSLDYKIPVGFGVLTVENIDQARDRYHVGGEAALAAVELALIN